MTDHSKRGRSLSDDLRRAWSLVDPRRPLYRDAHYFAATVEIDPEAMNPWLPPGVRLAGPPRADLFTASFPHNSFGSLNYAEAGIFVHVKTASGRVGLHCPWMVVNDDVALILGREMLGYPKKSADVDWNVTESTVSGAATRRGVELVRMQGRLGDTITEPPPILGRPHRNVVGSLGLFGSWIVAFTPRERVLEVRRVNDLELDITGSERDPIDLMGIGRVVEARLHRVDLHVPILPPVRLRPLSPAYGLSRIRPRVL